MDRWDGKVGAVEFRWAWPNWIMPKRRLPREQATEVQKYINAIVKRDFPYLIREKMGRQLWVEFCEYYAVNPDCQQAMRYL